MTAKELKFLQMFETFVKTDFLADKNLLARAAKSFMDLDYQIAADLWEYLATTREGEAAKDKRTAELLGQTLFEAFYARSSVKCIKAITDTAPIRRAVYQYSPAACSGDNFIVLTDILAANKIEQGDAILGALIKNERVSFGECLKRAIERVFIELLKKNPAKIEMNRKLSALLFTYIKRIKTDERAMLEQRIKEIM
jgi:hypothetical protein